MPDEPSHRRVIGWDLGGVHVKAALIEGGRVRDAVQAPCRLWRGLAALDESFALLPDWTKSESDHAVTMTGELTDCFADRAEGVARLAGWASDTLPGHVGIYAGRSGFVAPGEAAEKSADVASANWHATAALVGRRLETALLVDIGSTTADLIPIVDGQVAARGYSDAERLATGELVYSGVVRTPLLALTGEVPWGGQRTALMAETFATTADIFRLTGDLPDGIDQQQSADLKGKSIAESETRLARMIGRDRSEGRPQQWRALASCFVEAQLGALQDAAMTVLSRPDMPDEAPIVVCGAGAFLAQRLAERLERRSLPLTDVIGDRIGSADPTWMSVCGPAVAVGLLMTPDTASG